MGRTVRRGKLHSNKKGYIPNTKSLKIFCRLSRWSLTSPCKGRPSESVQAYCFSGLWTGWGMWFKMEKWMAGAFSLQPETRWRNVIVSSKPAPTRLYLMGSWKASLHYQVQDKNPCHPIWSNSVATFRQILNECLFSKNRDPAPTEMMYCFSLDRKLQAFWWGGCWGKYYFKK